MILKLLSMFKLLIYLTNISQSYAENFDTRIPSKDESLIEYLNENFVSSMLIYLVSVEECVMLHHIWREPILTRRHCLWSILCLLMINKRSHCVTWILVLRRLTFPQHSINGSYFQRWRLIWSGNYRTISVLPLVSEGFERCKCDSI